METLLQDEVDSDVGGLHHAVFNTVAAELDRATSRFLRQDPRPWRADVRREGALRVAKEDQKEVPFWAMVYGVPTEMVTEKLRTYEYEHQPDAYGITATDGTIATPSDVDRAVETRDGLFIQVGTRLYKMTEDDATPEQIDLTNTPAGNADRWTLASVSETERRMLVGEPKREEDVAAQIEGTDIQVHGTGRYKIDLHYTGVAVVEDGKEVVLPNYVEPLNLYNADGDRMSYSFSGNTDQKSIGPLYPSSAMTSNDPDKIFVGSVIEESSLSGEADGYTLFYHAKQDYEIKTPASKAPEGRLREMRVSFADELEHMDRMPSADDVDARQEIDRLCQVSVDETFQIDGQGFVGDVPVGHPIEHVLLSRHHVAVSGDGYVSVVEPAAGKVCFSQRYSEHTVKGLTWTKDIELALITAETNGFAVRALRPRRDVESDGLTPSYGDVTQR